MTRNQFGLLSAVLVLSTTASALAIIRRPGRDDSRYLELGAKHACVTRLSADLGIAVGPRFLN